LSQKESFIEIPYRIILSDAQCGSVIYAGEAHANHLAGSYTVDETYDLVSAAPADAPGIRAA
jgi:hypothetical protein